MVNSLLLERAIEKSGKKKGYLADKCGLSRASFLMKCKGESIFNAKEMQILCNELQIFDLEEKESIFFAKNVHGSVY